MKQIIGTFLKQRWTGIKSDRAEPYGTVKFDATQAILKRDLDFLHALQDGDETSDEIGLECVDWDGPCEVFGLTDSIAEFFELGEEDDSRFLMERITQAQLDEARDAYLVESDTISLVLELSVTYQLNGVNPESMRHYLEDMVRHAIGEGMLTGSSDAEVDSYGVHVYRKMVETVLEPTS
jgi:hypothetical protein